MPGRRRNGQGARPEERPRTRDRHFVDPHGSREVFRRPAREARSLLDRLGLRARAGNPNANDSARLGTTPPARLGTRPRRRPPNRAKSILPVQRPIQGGAGEGRRDKTGSPCAGTHSTPGYAAVRVEGARPQSPCPGKMTRVPWRHTTLGCGGVTCQRRLVHAEAWRQAPDIRSVAAFAGRLIRLPVTGWWLCPVGSGTGPGSVS